MLSLNIISHTTSDSQSDVISRKLTIDKDRSIALLISTGESRLSHILEEGMLEILAELTWNGREMTNDFSFVMERYNKFLANMAKTNEMADVHIFLGVTHQNTLIFSTLGQIEVKLIEHNGRMTDIGESVAGSHSEFTNISSGEIPLEGTVCVANIPLLSFLSRDDLDEFVGMDDEQFETIGKELLERETSETVHCIRLTTERVSGEKGSVFLEKGARHMNTVKGYSRDMLDKIGKSSLLKKITNPVTNLETSHQKRIQIGMFIVGVLFCIGLLWILFQNIFSFTQTTTQDDKNSFLNVTTLIDKAETDRANVTLFNEDIRQAEAILTTLESNPQYLKSITEIRNRIIALKKEVNGVETVNLTNQTSIIPLPESGFTPIIGFTSDTTKLSYAIGKEGMIGPYNAGATTANVITYPPGEIAKDAEISDEGLVYIIMESGHVFVQDASTSELVSVSVVGQDGWEKADTLKSFDGKLYLVTRSPAEIFRHTSRPNTSFSAKSVLYSNSGTLADVAIDGAAYVLGNDGKITKVIAGQTDTQTGILLNGIPGEYTVQAGGSIFVRPNLTFFYVMSGQNIWIFSPDSRNFRDLRSLTYVAQIEVSTNDQILSYFVPRDGNILVTTTKGIYSVDFQISDTADNKIIIDSSEL